VWQASEVVQGSVRGKNRRIVSGANSPFGAGSLTEEGAGEGVCRGVGSCCA
jgi:hypothetical protein